MNYHTETRKKRNYYAEMRKQRKKKKRLPPALLLIPLCVAVAVCAALVLYHQRNVGENGDSGVFSSAEEYYENNSVIIDIIGLEESDDVLTETQAVSVLRERGFGQKPDGNGGLIGCPVTYNCSMDGQYGEETEASDASDARHPMYRTFYVSEREKEDRIGWVIDVVNGEVFARPVSFGLETTCDKEILLTEDKEGKFTSYGDGKFYITVPYDTAVTAVTVDKIDAETLDGITFDDLCTLTGAVRLPSADAGGGISALSLRNYSGAALAASSAKAAGNETAVIVSLGDSFSSGEGNPPFLEQPDKTVFEKVKEEDWLAHRSTIAWPTLLQVPSDKNAASTKKVELHFAAVSGAVTENIGKTEQKKDYLKTVSASLNFYLIGSKKLPVQLSIFDTDKINGEDVDFVTLTIGGNDVGFADIIKQCVTGSSYLENALYNGTILAAKLNDIRTKLNATLNDIGNVYEAIAVKAPYAAILVAGYPKLFDAKGQFISMQEAELVNKAVSDFNDEIEKLVKACWRTGMNIYFVDVETKFDGHEAYATDENGNDIAWLNPIWLVPQPEDLKDLHIGSDYSIHPNKFGVQAYAACVNEEIAAYAESGDFGNNLHWKYDIRTDTLTISGTGDMPNFVELVEVGQQSFPWERFMHRIKEVIIEDGITAIGSFSFYEFDKLERVEIRGAVSRIGYRAFFGCDKLSAISNFPERLSDIGEGAFYGDALTDFYFAGDPPAALEASAGTYAASFAYGANGDIGKITLHYPASLQNKWDPDGDGKWKGYRVEPYDIVVSGTVIDFDTYEPVKNARIRITKHGDEKVHEAAADENGKFTVNVPGLAPVTLTIEISADGYEKQTLHQAIDIMVIQLLVPLRPSNSVTVTVVDGNGKGLSGIPINGTGLPSAPVTGADGSAKFRLSAGTYNLTVSDGTTTASKTLTVEDGPAELEIVLGQDDILEKLRNAKAGDVIKLTEDVEAEAAENVRISGGTEDNPVVLDLNGHTLTVTGTGEYNYFEVYKGALKIRDSSVTGTGTLDMSGYIAVYSSNLFLESGTLNVRGSAGSYYNGRYYNRCAIAISSFASFTMTGGTINRDANSIVGIYVDGSQSSFTMAGGTINGAIDVTEGSFTMDGGTINSGEVVTVNIVNARFTMNGGEIISSASVVVYCQLQDSRIILHGGRITKTSTGYCVQSAYKSSTYYSGTTIRSKSNYFFRYGIVAAGPLIAYYPSGYTSTDKPDEDGYYYLVKE